MKKSIIAVLSTMVVTLSVVSAHAAMMGSADVTVDVSDFKTIYTAGGATYQAGEFDVDVSIADLGLVDFDTFGYCVDISQGISIGSYNFEFNFLSEMNDDSFFEVAWLVDTFAPGNDVDNNAMEQYQAAALQGLIWETLSGSDYEVTNSSDWVSYWYDQYSSALSALTLSDSLKSSLEANYLIAANDTYQDLIVQVPTGSEIPEPATMVLFGVGLAGLACTRRNKKNS